MAGPNELNFASKVVFLSGQPLTLPSAASNPGTAVAADMYYNSTSNTVNYYNGSTWIDLSSGGGGVSSLNSLTGALSLVAGTNITLTPSGSDITISASGGGGSIGNFVFSGNTMELPSDSTGTAPTLTIQGANETGTNANGGNIALVTGTGNGTGLPGQTVFPDGVLSGGVTYYPSIAFSGDLTTGFMWIGSNTGIEKGLALVVGNSSIIEMGLNNSSQSFINIVTSSVYPDRSVMPASFGKSGNEWANIYTNLLTLGNQAVSGGRVEYISMQGWQYFGIGANDTTGNNWYFDGWDPGSNRYFEMFDIFQNNRLTSLYPGPDSANDSTAGQGLLIRGSNKTAGTGNGGDTTITAGTSSGGVIGNVVVQAASGAALATTATSGFIYIPTMAGTPTGTPGTTYTGTAPITLNTAGSALYAYVGGTWVSLTGSGGAPVNDPAFTGQVTFSGYHMEPSEYNAGNSGTAQTINWDTASAQLSTLTGNVTYTFSNPVVGGSYILRIATGAGGFTATWPGNVLWSGSTAPTITTTTSKVDLINFYYDGTYFYGSFIQNY